VRGENDHIEKDSRIEYAMRLIDELLENTDAFFSDDYLNSDGRRLFEEFSRIMLEKYPWLKKRIRKIRRDPSIHRIIDLRVELEH